MTSTAALPQPWFPEHINGVICPLAQAKLYPYPAPDGDFWMRKGLPYLCPDGISGDELSGRTPVISVGSNRAPLQLRRKFGLDAELPVTACVLNDCDITYAATLSFYCAVPATATPSIGTSVRLNIAWLDDAQLTRMHDTEALGVAYDFIRLNDDIVTIENPTKHAVFNQPIYGYQSRSGLLSLPHQIAPLPIAHAAIAAKGRVFESMDELAVLTAVKNLMGGGASPLDDWLLNIRGDKGLRLSVVEQMKAYAVLPPESFLSWKIVAADAPNRHAYI